ncbi:MAG: hypothetical protein ACETWB_07375 [Anaerolineae bacterium]
MVDETMQTSTPAVFAVGDVLCNHLKQAVIAAAEGAIAAMALERFYRAGTSCAPTGRRAGRRQQTASKGITPISAS